MNAQREWKKVNEGEYELLVNQEKVGNIQLVLNSLSSEANFNFGGDAFTIKRTGFWKNALEISNQKGVVLTNIAQEKWYANTLIMNYKNKVYKLSIRNNPLAEWVLEENNELVLAYGLSAENGKVSVKISSSENHNDYLFDFVLWYLFLPIATENTSQDLLFTLLVA